MVNAKPSKPLQRKQPTRKMKELIQLLIKVLRFLILIFVPFFIIGAFNGFVFKDFSAIQWLFLVILIWTFDDYLD